MQSELNLLRSLEGKSPFINQFDFYLSILRILSRHVVNGARRLDLIEFELTIVAHIVAPLNVHGAKPMLHGVVDAELGFDWLEQE